MQARYILSAAGLIAIAVFEGFSSAPYKDTGGVWTNGFGNTHNAQKKVSVQEALTDLKKNTISAENAVNRCITQEMPQRHFDAFVSLTYNIGNQAFCKSTLVRKYNAGDTYGACRQILRWVYVKGRRVQGLANRRQKEYLTCVGGQ